MTSPEGYPVMTTWQYGLGQVAAMGFDAGPRWSQQWLSWEGYPRFWTQLVRWALRRHEGDDTAMEVAFENGQGLLRVARRTPEGLTEVEGGIHAWLAQTGPGGEQSGKEQGISLNVVEPGLWNAQFNTEPGQRYTIRVANENGQVFASQTFVSPSSEELRHEGADMALLAHLAEESGGAVGAEAALQPLVLSEVTRPKPLWLYFLCCTLLLMPVDAFLRRPGREI
jgi:hypothetical protein